MYIALTNEIKCWVVNDVIDDDSLGDALCFGDAICGGDDAIICGGDAFFADILGLLGANGDALGDAFGDVLGDDALGDALGDFGDFGDAVGDALRGEDLCVARNCGVAKRSTK
jgi:hypothetical protein